MNCILENKIRRGIRTAFLFLALALSHCVYAGIDPPKPDDCPTIDFSYDRFCNGSEEWFYFEAPHPTPPAGGSGSSGTYTWDFGDGQTNSGIMEFNFALNHQYSVTGTYTVTLTWTPDPAWNCSPVVVSHPVYFFNAVHNFSSDVSTAPVNSPVVFTFSASYPSFPASTFFYNLDFGNGDFANNVTSTYTWTPTAPGTYSVVLHSIHPFSDAPCDYTDMLEIVVTGVDPCITTIVPPLAACVNSLVVFNTSPALQPSAVVSWSFGDGITSTNSSHIYTSPGTYTVLLTYQVDGCDFSNVYGLTITIEDCRDISCKDCIGSFAPLRGEKYVLSAWVQQSGSANEITYNDPAITLDFSGTAISLGPFKGKGQIIDSWQRIEEEFIVPSGATDITIKLFNTGSGNEVYFDDIRIHPFNSNLKSFVYDPSSLRLTAELDANNYATFYEYDEEGALVRVKKETERGIVTIKETRNNNKK